MGISGLKKTLKSKVFLADLPKSVAKQILKKQLCSFSKSSQRSRVHRPAYYDYVLIKEFDSSAKVCTEHRFVGLYTSTVYGQPPLQIPLLRVKVQNALDRSGFSANGHNIKALLQVITVLPREELIQLSEQQLFETALQIEHIQER